MCDSRDKRLDLLPAADGVSVNQKKALRILIIAHAFPPTNTIATHRPYSWARVWRDQGHEIHVLTPVKHGFDGTLDLECDLSGIQVHEVAYLPRRHVPSAGAHRWEWVKALTRRIRFSLGMFGDPRLMAYPSMLQHGSALMQRHRFDFIIATSPPEMVFFVARALSHRTGVPWVADFRDAWFHNLRLYHAKLAASVAGPVNRWLVKTASALVTVSRGLQQRLSSYLGREVALAYNGYYMAERNQIAQTRVWNDSKLHIAYTGRVYPGKQNPEPLFHALALLRQLQSDLPNRLSVDFYGFDGPWLRPLIDKHHVQDCVTLHGFVPYRDSINVQRAADLLLFLDWVDGGGDGMLTGKLFEYLGSGRPIFALGVRKDSEASCLIADTGCGTTLTSVDEIVNYLQNLLASGRPPRVQSVACDFLSREEQARVLLDQLSKSL